VVQRTGVHDWSIDKGTRENSSLVRQVKEGRMARRSSLSQKLYLGHYIMFTFWQYNAYVQLKWGKYFNAFEKKVENGTIAPKEYTYW